MRLLPLAGVVVLGLSVALPPAATWAATTGATKTMSEQKAKHSRWQEKVMKVQTALNGQGAHPALKVDGHYGKLTRKAVEDFQSSHGLKATGKLDKETLKALKIG